MLIVSYSNISLDNFIEKYNDKVIKLEIDDTNITNDVLIQYIEDIKSSILNYEIVIIPYINEVVLCLDTLSIEYYVAYPDEEYKEAITNVSEYDILRSLGKDHSKIIINVGETLETVLNQHYKWINIEDDKNQIDEYSLVIADTVVEETPPAIDKKNLTLQELIEHDVDITEADIRDLKSTTNKFKVAMLLQAKSRLNTVLKLCDVLDKLYDELVNRIDVSLATTDTPSLMYTTDYIAKALSETNQFIMSLITNEKIQNFFIIDNSSIINITDNRVDLDKREKIRKAAEIVLDNTDYFTNGQYDKVVNPNIVLDENGVDNNGNTTT